MALAALQVGPVADGGLRPHSVGEVRQFDAVFSFGRSGRIQTYSGRTVLGEFEQRNGPLICGGMDR